MPDDEELVEEMDEWWTPIPSSEITGNENPHALGWYEWDEPIVGGGVAIVPDPVLTQDTTVVPGKTYWRYYTAEGEDSTMSEAQALAYSTYQTYLMYKTTSAGTYTNLLPIKDYPDMIGDPNMLDCTTLSDSQEKQISGILRLGDGFQFTANYTPENFTKVKGLEGHQYWYALWLGGNSGGEPDGHNGKFEWTGDVRAGFPGKGVDEVQDMTITATPSTDVQWSAGT